MTNPAVENVLLQLREYALQAGNATLSEDELAVIVAGIDQAGEHVAGQRRDVVVADRLVADEPLSEKAHRLLMRLHYRRGDRSAALAAYARCAQWLQLELAASPSGETRELAQLIERAGDLPGSVPRRIPAALARPPVLVGRERQWRALEDAWEQGRAAVLVADAGMGKTRLALEAAARQAIAFLDGACFVSLAAVAVVWVVLRRLKQAPARRGGVPLGLVRDVLRNRASWPLLVCGLINFPVLFVIQGVLGKKFLQDAVGLSSAQAAAFVLVMASVCGLSAVCGGPVLRLTRQRRKPVIVGSTGAILLSTVLMLVAVLAAAPGWVFLTGYVLLALSIVGSPATSATMKEINRPDAVAVTISVLNTAAYLGVGILSNAAGAILDAFGSHAEAAGTRIVYPTAAYATLFACLAGLALVSTLVTVLLIPETHGRAVTLQEIERR